MPLPSCPLTGSWTVQSNLVPPLKGCLCPRHPYITSVTSHKRTLRCHFQAALLQEVGLYRQTLYPPLKACLCLRHPYITSVTSHKRTIRCHFQAALLREVGLYSPPCPPCKWKVLLYRHTSNCENLQRKQ